MRVLVACEFSGIVRDAFAAAGHEAWSCDLEPSERPGNHYRGDVRDILNSGWDLMIAHPPCTYLSKAGAVHMYNGRIKANGINFARLECVKEAGYFFNELLWCSIPLIAVENPVMHHWAREIVTTPYSQIIQPFEHGHAYSKKTCLWLRGLPEIKPTKLYQGRVTTDWVSKVVNGSNRKKLRSKTFTGIAKAMAEQWGSL